MEWWVLSTPQCAPALLQWKSLKILHWKKNPGVHHGFVSYKCRKALYLERELLLNYWAPTCHWLTKVCGFMELFTFFKGQICCSPFNDVSFHLVGSLGDCLWTLKSMSSSITFGSIDALIEYSVAHNHGSKISTRIVGNRIIGWKLRTTFHLLLFFTT